MPIVVVLPGAIAAEKAGDRTARDGKADVVDRGDAGEDLGQTDGFDGRFGHRRTSALRRHGNIHYGQSSWLTFAFCLTFAASARKR